MMLSQIQDKFRRRLGRMRGNAICARQKNPLASYPKTIVTTFYDFEGDYAMPNKTHHSLQAVEKILQIEKKYNIKSTYNTVAKYAEEIPDIMHMIEQHGHEVASHSYDHRVLTGLSGAEQKSNANQAKELFSELGFSINGHRSPQSSWNHRLMHHILHAGYQWNAENGDEPYPYVYLSSSGQSLWRFPIRDDDWAYQGENLTPAAMLDRWKSKVNAGREKKQYTAIGFHPWVEYPEARMEVFEQFMAWLSSLDDVVVMPFGSVFDLLQSIKQDTGPTRSP